DSSLNLESKRTEFPHWIGTGGKCDTRERKPYLMFILKSKTNPEYDAKSWNDAQHLDIDHVVPLKEGWGAGAWNWTRERRKMFANDLVRPQLIAVTASENFRREPRKC
ncbi:unnamed protein product, partial [Rhizoctonia solani]